MKKRIIAVLVLLMLLDVEVACKPVPKVAPVYTTVTTTEVRA